MSVKKTDTIRSLKAPVLQEFGGAANSGVAWIFKQRCLDENQEVGGFRIVEGDSISLVLRFPEVAFPPSAEHAEPSATVLALGLGLRV